MMAEVQTRPVVLAAGGTGGHVFPAEALAGELEARGVPFTLFTDTRKYMEAGLTKNIRLAKGASLEASVRYNRTENFAEYSYRVLGIVDLGWHLLH